MTRKTFRAWAAMDLRNNTARSSTFALLLAQKGGDLWVLINLEVHFTEHFKDKDDARWNPLLFKPTE